MSRQPGPRPVVREAATGVRLDVRVTPRSSRSRIEGVRDGRLAIRVTAPPVDRAANAAVTDLVAAALGVARGSVRVVSGATSRTKTIEIVGVSAERIRDVLLLDTPA